MLTLFTTFFSHFSLLVWNVGSLRIRAGRTTVQHDGSVGSATKAWHKLSVRGPEQLVPPLNIQIGRELSSEEAAAESNPLTSRPSNDKIIYACSLCLD